MNHLGAELNQDVFEDGISINIKSLNEHFSKLHPLLDLIIKSQFSTEFEFEKVKKSSIDLIKKDKENPFNLCFEKWRKIVYSTTSLCIQHKLAMQMTYLKLPIKMF